MVRLLWTAVFALFVSVAVAEPFQATVTQDVEVRDGALSTDPVVTTLSAGSVVTVRDCILDQCLLDLPDIALENAPWADVAAFAVTGTSVTEFVAAQRSSARNVQLPLILSRNIRTEGDSYMAGAYEVKLFESIARTTGRQVVNTAVGGSEMSQVADRFESPSASQYLGWVTVVWDGSHNGMTDAKTCTDQLQSAIDKLGHDRFIVVPALHGGDRADVVAEFRSRWPDNFLGWQEVLGDYRGGIPDEWLARPEDDQVHLNEQAMDQMAEAIGAFISTKGW